MPDHVLVVDSANTVGSVPDGWWRDRQAATVRLRDHLGRLAEQAPPGHRIILVTEGRARGVTAVPGVEVEESPGEGDDHIVEVTRREVAGGAGVVVATADRELQGRVRALGAEVMPPTSIRHGR